MVIAIVEKSLSDVKLFVVKTQIIADSFPVELEIQIFAKMQQEKWTKWKVFQGDTSCLLS